MSICYIFTLFHAIKPTFKNAHLEVDDYKFLDIIAIIIIYYSGYSLMHKPPITLCL